MSHPFIPVANTALVEMVYTYAGQIIENTYHVQRGSPFDSSALQSLTQNVFDVWDSTGTNRQVGNRTGGCVLVQVKGRALDSIDGAIYIYTLTGGGRAGGISTNAGAPGNVTFPITLQTGRAGRSYRGRIFVPGVNFGQIQAAPSQNLMTNAAAIGWVACLNALITQVHAVAADYHLVVTSYRNDKTWRAAGYNEIILNAAYASLALASQRRRLAFRGA